MVSALSPDPQAQEKVTYGAIEFDALLEQVLAVGRIRLDDELTRLRSLGIIDEAGERVSKELPEDMRPGADTDFGG